MNRIIVCLEIPHQTPRPEQRGFGKKYGQMHVAVN